METTTQTIPPAVAEEVQSHDLAVVKEETIDVEFLNQLIANKEVASEDKAKLRGIKKNLRGTHNVVTYKLGRSIKHEFLGRLCAVKGFGLQSLSRNIRNAIAQQNYHDIDVVNAQPTILLHICERNGWDHQHLKTYITQREELLTQVVEKVGGTRAEAKQRIVSILFGQRPYGLPEFFMNEFYTEIRKIQENVWNTFGSKLKFLERLDNRVGKSMAHFLQTEEKKVLLAMDNALARRNRRLDTLIHDGGLCLKLPDEVEFPIGILREVEAEIKEKTGYAITLAIKPMTTIYVKQDESAEDEEYKRLKEEFETTIFKVRHPSVFVRSTYYGLQVLTHKDLIHQTQQIGLEDGSRFISRWLIDESQRTYEKLTFKPKGEVPSGEFNLWTKFAIDPVPNQSLIAPVQELLQIISNYDPRVMWFIENWLARMFQTPWLKTCVCLVFSGEQGSGKDTFWDFIGTILGETYYFKTDSPENNVMANFNTGTERCVLVKFEEATYVTNKATADKLKSKITSHEEKYTKKGQDPISLPDYRNFVMTTNHQVPVQIEQTDRRFMLVETSNDKVGDHAFWNVIQKKLAKPEVRAAYHAHLMSLDVSDFDPQRDRIKTAYYEQVKQAFTPTHARWFQKEVEHLLRNVTEDDGTDYSQTYKARDLYNRVKEFGKFDMTENQFGREMSKYVAGGALQKREGNTHNEYTMNPQVMMTFLRSKGWWANL